MEQDRHTLREHLGPGVAQFLVFSVVFIVCLFVFLFGNLIFFFWKSTYYFSSMSNTYLLTSSLLCLMAHRARTSFLHSSLLLSLLCLMTHRARTSFLHSSLLLAFLSIVPHVYPLSFISFLMVRLHVVFGLPLCLFPSGVHLRATFVMSSDGLRRT